MTVAGAETARTANAPPPELALPDETVALALRGLSEEVEEDRNPKLLAREGFRDLDDDDDDGGVEVEMEKEVAAAAAMIV